jgi:hypothetical protein
MHRYSLMWQRSSNWLTSRIVWLAQRLRMQQEDRIRAVVFRHQLVTFAPIRGRHVYFLGLGRGRACHDPSTSLLRLFQSHTPSIKPFSSCAISHRGYFCDSSTQLEGLLFYITQITWQTSRAATVEGGYSTGRGGAYHRYDVVWRRGEWKIKSDKMVSAQ